MHAKLIALLLRLEEEFPPNGEEHHRIALFDKDRMGQDRLAILMNEGITAVVLCPGDLEKDTERLVSEIKKVLEG